MIENKIIRDLRVLTEEFIPSRILHRDSQLDAVKAGLAPLLVGGRPRHAFLYGPPGTGKTSLSLHVAEELKKQIPVHFFYVNCWEAATRFSILYKILQTMGTFVQRKGIPTDELLETFRNRTRGKQVIVMLDEVDRLEEDEVLYDLIEAQAGLVMASNSESALFNADPRIRSRLAATETIQFRRYSERELIDILKDRRQWGLVPGALNNENLEAVARLANGDARVALGILSRAAQKAEEKDLEKIPAALIDASLPHAMHDSRRRTLDSLNPHQRLLISLLDKGPQKAGDLYDLAAGRCAKQGLEDLVDRTFRKYMERLVRHGLVTAEGDGRWRVYKVAQAA